MSMGTLWPETKKQGVTQRYKILSNTAPAPIIMIAAVWI